MDLDKFKNKWDKEIKQGIVKISEDNNTIVADRWDGTNFLCERSIVDRIQNDLRNMNYFKLSMGVYSLKESDYIKSSMFCLEHYHDLTQKQKTI